MAGISNGSNYLNAFRRNPSLSYPLEELLAEVWDFDSDIVVPSNGEFIDPKSKPFRAYWQLENHKLENQKQEPLFSSQPFLTYLPTSSWGNYPFMSLPEEVPPLPPTASNSNTENDDISGGSNQGLLNYKHHLIRDFMFTDATCHNQPADGPYTDYVESQAPRRYIAVPRELKPDDPVTFAEDPKLNKYTRGTKDTPHVVPSKYLVVLDDIHNKKPLAFKHSQELSYTAKYYQLISTEDNSEVRGIDVVEAPNWFGVAVPKGCKDFSNVIIYFHPGPKQAGYRDEDYPARNGDHGTNWKQLFAYVDRLGTQMTGAIETYGDIYGTPRDQIVIVPFMPGWMCDVDDEGFIGNAGNLPDQWYYIVNDIIQDLAKTMGGN